MSKALLKRSMQILEDSKPKHIFAPEKLDTSKTKNGKGMNYFLKNQNSIPDLTQSPADPFPVKRKKQKKVQPMKPVATGASKVDENVKKLLKLSSFKLNDKLVKAAFKRSASRHYTLPDKEKAPEQTGSIFSEEDFARFAAEYTV